MWGDPEWHCIRKRPFETREECMASIKRELKEQQKNIPLWPYQCPVCKKWHKTKQLPKEVEV